MAGGPGDGVRPGGGAANHSEAATDGGSDDGGVAQLLQEDCPVKHSARWDLFLQFVFPFSPGISPKYQLFFLLPRFFMPSLRLGGW